MHRRKEISEEGVPKEAEENTKNGKLGLLQRKGTQDAVIQSTL
jgi:hypothetical protein